MMRKNLLIGMLGLTIMAIVAGDYLFNRSIGAQDSPKKADADTKKSDPFYDLLKKDLEPQKPNVVLPPLAPPNGEPPSPKPDFAPPPGDPFGGDKGPSGFPPIQKPGFPELPPMPMVDIPKKPHEPHHKTPKKTVAPETTPVIPMQKPTVAPVPPALGYGTFTPVPSNSFGTVKPDEKNANPPANTPFGTVQEPPLSTPSGSTEPKKDKHDVKPPLDAGFGTQPTFPPAASTQPAQPRSTPLTGPVRLKNSPWSLHVDVVNEQTIVTATVNKKHEFKIICQHLDLQTTHGTLKASGKVQISGDALQASCEFLAIPLHEDRLLLEGNAEVRIRKTSSSPGDGDVKPGVFELKGEVLNLRVSEMQSARFIETSMQQAVADTPLDDKSIQAVSPSDSKKWSPYGKLSRTKMTHDGLAVWSLEDNNGQAIVRFVARGNLTAYEGRTISVLCTAIDKSMLRVTHIAVP